MAWTSSDRRQRLPANWDHIRSQVKARAQGKCEALAHVFGCDGIGAECDHIKQGDDHSLGNLAWLSTACHAAKTRADNRVTKRLVRPAERHPGSL